MSKNNGDKVKIHWWEDPYGIQTCHFNESGASFKDSYIGKVFVRDNAWFAEKKGSEAPETFKSRADARKFLEDSVNGEPV